MNSWGTADQPSIADSSAGNRPVSILIPRWLRILLYIAALIVGVTTLFHIVSAWRGTIGLNHVTGAWVALAIDAADGTLYRPRLSDAGYGGTRFFPLHIALHASLIKSGLQAVNAGRLLTTALALLLCTAAFWLLRRLNVAIPLALAGAGLVLATSSAQLAVTTIRGDLLPLVFILFALAFSQGGRYPSSMVQVFLAAACLTLAFAAKITALYAFPLAAYALLTRGLYRQALLLLILSILGYGLVIALTDWASDGRFLQIIRDCLLAGDGASRFLSGPRVAVKLFLIEDPNGLVIQLLALATLIFGQPGNRRGLLAVSWMVVTAATAFMLGSSGMDFNHLLDWNVFAVLFLVRSLGEQDVLPDPRPFALILAFSSIAFCSPLITMMRKDPFPDLVPVNRVVQSACPSDRIFCENPMVPAFSGNSPFLLDAFMFGRQARRHVDLRDDLLARLNDRSFSMLILDERLGDSPDEFYSQRICSGFWDAVQRNYTVQQRIGRSTIYAPRTLP